MGRWGVMNTEVVHLEIQKNMAAGTRETADMMRVWTLPFGQGRGAQPFAQARYLSVSCFGLTWLSSSTLYLCYDGY